MNQDNRIIGGGISDLLGHGDVYTPGAFDFVQKSEPVVRMAGGGFLDDEMLLEDFGLPIGNSYAAPPPPPVVPIAAQAPAVVGAPMAAPAPSPVVSPFNQGLSQDQSFDDLMSYVMSGQPTMKAVSAPAPTTPQFDPTLGLPDFLTQAPAAPVAAPAPAYAPAPSPVYTAAPAPKSLFGMDVMQDQLADLGVSAPAPSPVQAPAPTPAAQAPAPVAKQGYSAFSGDLSPELIKLLPKSGDDVGRGAWQFDTQADREREAYAAQFGGNPETGTPGGSGVNAGRPLMQMTEVQDENGNWISQPTNELDKRYGLTDTTGLVHGTQTVPVDKTHIKVTNAFFDPKTGKMVGQPIVGTYEQKRSASDLITDALFAAATGAIAGPLAGALGGGAMGAGLAGAALGGAQASVAGGDVLKGALTGGLGAGLGNVASGYINPAAASAGQAVGGGTLGDIVSGAVKGAGTSATKALVSGKSIGDALLSGALGGGASAGIGSLVGQTGLPPELAKIAAPALTAAVLGKDPATAALNAAIGQIIGAAKTGGETSGADAGAMTAGEADERKGVSEVTDLINNLAFAPTPSPAPAPEPAPAPAPAPEPAPAPSPAPAAEPAPAPAPATAGVVEVAAPAVAAEDQALLDLITQAPAVAAAPAAEPAPAPAPTPAPAPEPASSAAPSPSSVEAPAPDVFEQLAAAGIDVGAPAAAPEPPPPPPPPPPAPAPEPAPAPAPSTDTGEEETESEEDKEGTEAAIDALTKGADTAAGVSGADLTAGTSDQTVQDLLDAGLTSADTGETQTAEDLARELGLDTGTEGTSTGTEVGAAGEDTTTGAEGDETKALSDDELNKFFEDIGTGGSSVTSESTSDLDTLLSQLSGEDANKPSSLSEQAKFLESNVEDAGDIDQLLKDYAIDTGQLQGDYAGVGNLGQDFVVTETGDIKDTAGNYGNFDPATGEWTPYTEQLDVSDDLQTVDVIGKKLDDLEDYGLTDREIEDRDTVRRIIDDFGYTAGGGDSGTGGGTGGSKTGGGGTSTKTTTTTTPTAAKSSFDPMALFALSAMLSQQPETVKERENAARIAAKSPFGTLPYSDILDAYNQIYGA